MHSLREEHPSGRVRLSQASQLSQPGDFYSVLCNGASLMAQG